MQLLQSKRGKIVVISGTRRDLGAEEKGEVTLVLEGAADALDVREWRVGDCPTGVDQFVTKRFGFDSSGRWLKLEPLEVFEADWDKHELAAGPIRNRKMLGGADLLLAFPARTTLGTFKPGRGTMNAIKQALELNIDVVVSWLL